MNHVKIWHLIYTYLYSAHANGLGNEKVLLQSLKTNQNYECIIRLFIYFTCGASGFRNTL